MIRCIRYLWAICHLGRDAESLIGENVWTAAPNEFPFIASIGLRSLNIHVRRLHFCGGSLITRQHILTAAHCLENRSVSEIDVIIGEQDLSIARFMYQVDSWITYDEWAQSLGKIIESRVNDVAIVKLTSNVNNRSDISPVTLTWLNDQRLYRIKAVIAGWGETSEGSINELRKTSVTIMTPESCKNRIKIITNESVQLLRNTLCSSADPYALTSCGDSGGPVLNKHNVLLGIVRSTCPREEYQWGNFSQEFIHRYRVNLHQSVDYYREFIEDVTNFLTRPREVLSFQSGSDQQFNEISHG